MSTSRDEVRVLLDALASLMRSITSDDITRLREGSSRLALVDVSDATSEARSMPAANEGRDASSRTRTPFDPSTVLGLLDTSTTRDDALRMLQDQKLSSGMLKELASHLEIRTQKGDSTEVIMEKIIEATVGLRLRGAAIRGEKKP